LVVIMFNKLFEVLGIADVIDVHDMSQKLVEVGRDIEVVG